MEEPPPWLSPERTAWVAVWTPWAICWERRMRWAQSGTSPEEAGVLGEVGLAPEVGEAAADPRNGEAAAAAPARATPPRPPATPDSPDWPAAPVL